jgi:hypothetical protein
LLCADDKIAAIYIQEMIEYAQEYEAAVENYIIGQWDAAMATFTSPMFRDAQTIAPLCEHMLECDMKVPKDWQGYRKMVNK